MTKSLRFRLIILLLLGLCPALALTIFNHIEHKRLAFELARERTLRLATYVAEQNHVLVETTRQVLAALSEEPVIKGLDVEACNRTFSVCYRMSPLSHYYANLGVADRDGNILWAVIGPPRQVRIDDRKYFRDAVKTGKFAVGIFQISRTTGKPTVDFGYPVFDGKGQVYAVVVAALDLAWFSRLASADNLPEGSVLTIIDRRGTVLGRSLNPERWVGKHSPEVDVVKKVPGRTGGRS